MDALIDFLRVNPLYAVGLVVLILFLAFALIKKMLSISLLAVVLTIAYVYYLQDMAEDAYAKTKNTAENLLDEAESFINR